MTRIDRAQVYALLTAGDIATTTTARGRAREDLIAYLFELIPGITVTARNQLNAFGAEEVDVAFWNEGDPASLRMFGHLLLVEAKNWSTPAGYPEIAVFNGKLRSRGRPLRIFCRSVRHHRRPFRPHCCAHSVLARALSEGREILVLTRSEIEKPLDTDELVRLLKRKHAQLAVSGTIFQQ